YTTAFANLIYVQRDTPFDVASRPYLPTVLETSAPEFTLKCGRQVGKTTKVGGLLALHGCTTPGYPHMYITPRGDQAKDFSRNKFSVMMRESRFLSRFVPGQRSRDEA